MIDFVQESGRMRVAGNSIVVLTQPGQQQEQQAPRKQVHKQEMEMEMDDSEAIEAFVRAAGCRREVMSQYMDGKQLSCAKLQARLKEAGAEVALCDKCEEQQSSGRRAWQDEQAVQAVQEQVVRAKLDELSQSTCPYCWAVMHEVFHGQAGKEEEQESIGHSLWQCPLRPDMGEMEEIRRGVWYSRAVRTCRKCGMMDFLCERDSSSGGGRESGQQNCAWPNVVIPLLYGLRAVAEAKVIQGGNDASARTRTTLGRVGYREEDSSRVGFSKWIGRQCTGKRVFGRVVGNGVAAVVVAILEEQR
jgi:hypothetical protein